MRKAGKKVSLILAFVLTLGMSAGLFSACGNRADAEGVLNIYIHNAGYGTDFVEPLGKIFKEKTGIEVKMSAVADNADLFTQLESGVSKADLLFSSNSVDYYTYIQKTIGGQTYPCLLEDLTDIYKANVPGEDVTLEEKMYDEYLAHNATVKDGETKYYSVPWISGLNGILINGETWNDAWKEPRTTNELLELCDTIKAAGQMPFIYCLENSYWGTAITPAWAAQYMGEDEVALFNEGKDIQGRQYVPEILNYQGFLEAIKVVGDLLDADKNYMHPYSMSLDFTSVQNVFLEGAEQDGNIVMMPNGDWLEREMSANYGKDECDIRFISLPVISSLGTKLGITEDELCSIIDYIDGKTTVEPNFASTKGLEKQEVLDAVTYARKLNPAYSYEHEAFIPVYAQDKEEAKQFLQFLASDEGIEAFVRESGGYTLPYDYDYLNSEATKNEFSAFQKSALEIIGKSRIFEFEMKDRIFAVGGVKIPGTNISTFYETYLSANKSTVDYKSAEDVFADDYNFVKNRWTLIKTNAGIA